MGTSDFMAKGAKRTKPNQLFYGDNLHVLREHVASTSVDLVYLDPPFNGRGKLGIALRLGDFCIFHVKGLFQGDSFETVRR